MRRNLVAAEEGWEYIGGRNVLTEALKAEREIDTVFLEKGSSSADPRIHDIIAGANAKGIKVEYVEKKAFEVFEKTTYLPSEGAIALVRKREVLTVDDVLALCKEKQKEPFILVVNNILYAQNLGAILRTAAAAGVDALIVPKREKREVDAEVSRISMGGSEYVPLVSANLFESLDRFHKEGIIIIGVELNGSSYYFEADLTGPCVLVLGGEDAGLTNPLQKRCDRIVKIPMLRPIQSLNVSVSAALVMYEKIRQECQN